MLLARPGSLSYTGQKVRDVEGASSRQERKKKREKRPPHSTAIPKREKGEEKQKNKKKTATIVRDSAKNFLVMALFR